MRLCVDEVGIYCRNLFLSRSRNSLQDLLARISQSAEPARVRVAITLNSLHTVLRVHSEHPVGLEQQMYRVESLEPLRRALLGTYPWTAPHPRQNRCEGKVRLNRGTFMDAEICGCVCHGWR